MIFKKRYLLFIIFLIIVFQTLLYINNNQKTSLRYFKWTVQEVTIGKLISISFFSGLIMSTFLNSTFTSYQRNIEENTEENNNLPDDDEDVKSNLEIPPQRDIRDTQPTISVNYRVVKNSEVNNLKNENNQSNDSEYKDDWDNYETDW